MFDKYYPTQHQHTSVPTTVNHKYENCNALETARFLKELQDEAKSSVFESVNSKNNIVEFNCAFLKSYINNKIFMKIKINDEIFEKEFFIPSLLKDELLNFLIKELNLWISECICNDAIRTLIRDFHIKFILGK